MSPDREGDMSNELPRMIHLENLGLEDQQGFVTSPSQTIVGQQLWHTHQALETSDLSRLQRRNRKCHFTLSSVPLGLFGALHPYQCLTSSITNVNCLSQESPMTMRE